VCYVNLKFTEKVLKYEYTLHSIQISKKQAVKWYCPGLAQPAMFEFHLLFMKSCSILLTISPISVVINMYMLAFLLLYYTGLS
jgi:hypothetical protein